MQKKVAGILPIQAMKLPMQAMKLPALLTTQAMRLPALPMLPVPPPPPQDQIILMSMALVYLLPLPSVFVYFLHILKIKNSSMKNRINHQNDVICFRKVYNKRVVLIGEKTLKTPLRMD